MSDIPQLLAAIDGRLADLAAEITALETAKAALNGPRTRTEHQRAAQRRP